ncbi:protein ANTAGONIST OF LIKE HETEROCHROMATIN PROTEIN 1-like [Rhizophagus clarus]|uniref:Protein ANTAGONIST OF LIKE HETEROCHROMATIN PROTEIN 1-like n=1 Tax=Rhizophagus clarus TaxID=94130 RepID=A0A8H3QQR0_9GLOM|nr:protein ANTAGONIST OF LIKE HETEROCHROMATIN PROTEIN 1-like [Rhizophagus clarus]
MLGLVALNEVCYLEPRIYNIAKSQYWYHNILPSYDDIRFKKIMRIFSENFKKLVNLLKDWNQKKMFFSICSRYGIAKGTILLYCKRIMKAIISYKSNYIKWPTNEQDREFVHDGFESIGGIIDHHGIFISYDVGWLGSVHDAKVYRNFHFYLNRTSLIKGNDFLIGDSAYPLSPFLIKPFSKPNENQTEFNHIFSLYRIVVEHLFGRIKNRFGGIKKISVKKISTAVNIIDCSIILHNFLELNNDIWVDNENNDNSEEDSNESDNYYNNNEESLKRAGEAKRNWIMSKLFTTL